MSPPMYCDVNSFRYIVEFLWLVLPSPTVLFYLDTLLLDRHNVYKLYWTHFMLLHPRSFFWMTGFIETFTDLGILIFVYFDIYRDLRWTFQQKIPQNPLVETLVMYTSDSNLFIHFPTINDLGPNNDLLTFKCLFFSDSDFTSYTNI